jgi:signal peptidase I
VLSKRLAVAAIILMAAIGGWCISTGRVSYVITHGVSMNPVYHEDDLVVVLKSDLYQVGEIVAYRSPSTGVEVLHRIIGGSATDGYQFKGDNNKLVDPEIPTADQLIGQAVLHVPKGGVWLKPVLSPTGLGMMGFLIVGGAATTARTRREIPRGRRKKKVKAMARQGGSWAVAIALAKAAQRLHPVLRAAAAMIMIIAISALTLGVLGWIKPVLVNEAAVVSEPQAMTFAYSATVPRSPAYDSTTVTSPDPVFRKLADYLELKMHYTGPPGVFDAYATVADTSGWHTTILLLKAKRFTTRSLDSLVNLNLDALEDRAKAASNAIGITPSTLTVTINARVESAGSPPFTAPLALTLAPLQLTLAGGAGSLLVVNPPTATTTVVRTIDVFGHPIMTAARARGLAIMLLLAAVAGAAALFFVLRRDSPLRTRQEIERRYPTLLVPVEPMASPPGKPVVNVDNFPALVKLAERYGQMILTWSRPDSDDFVVRDEGITYRYRIGFDEAPPLQSVERIERPSSGSHRRKATNQAT